MADENEIFNISSDDRNEIDYSDWEEMEESFSDQEENESNSSDSEEMIEPCSKLEDEPQTVAEQNGLKRVYLPNLESDEDVPLECDLYAYKMYCPINIGVSCSSFDVISDSLGNNRADQYPLAMTLVCGTQMENKLGVMKISNINQTKPPKEDDDDEDEEESESDSEAEDEAECNVELVAVHHPGGVNRIKVTEFSDKVIAASWSEKGKVYVWDLTLPINAVNNHHVMKSYIQNSESPRPMFSFAGHLSEGFAMEWSPLVPGMLATGDCKSRIHLWKHLEGGTWHVDQRPYIGHAASVEDLEWSPVDANFMASCSVDKTLRIWDIRAPSNKACMLTRHNAHDSDVNVISWDKTGSFILSGGDDGKLRVWDLRMFPEGDPICTFKYHTAPITSVEWHPTDHSVFAASGADDQLTQWDLAVERDDIQEEEKELSPEILALPPQLLFMHQGQKEIKELHWHKQMPGVLISTALNGFDLFRTLSV